MIVHPELRALRGDDTPQRDAQGRLIAAADAWRARPDVAAVLSALDDFAAGGGLDGHPALSRLFDAGDAPRDLVDGFVMMMAGKLRADPLGHVPLRHFTDGVLSTLILARAGNATLALVALDGDGLATRPPPSTVDFNPNESWERVLAGTARAELIDRAHADDRRATLIRRTVELAPGTVIARDGERRSLHVLDVDGCLVTLRLQRRRARAGVTREYRLDDGALAHQAAANPRDSRLELMIALLGRMGRVDAAPLIADIAGAQGSAGLRWQALRECLALDTLAGFRALCAIADNDADPIAAPAQGLRAQLLDSYPQLAEMRPCPA